MKLRDDAVSRCSEMWERAELGDPRRTRRLVEMAKCIARRPAAPLPVALGTDAAVQGAYRLVNNRRMDFATLMAVQGEMTRLRAEEEADGDVLVLHDTTDCSFPHLDPEEVGYLNTGKAGFRLHGSLAVHAAGWRRPIGVVAAETIHRAKPRRTTRGAKPSGVETATWEDKEFDRWRRGIETSQSRLASCRSVIHIADRESDSYALMHATLAVGGRFIFRVRVDRRGRAVDDADGAWSTVKTIARNLEGRFEREGPLSARKAKGTLPRSKAHPVRRARVAQLQFSATRVEVPRPRTLGAPIPAVLTLNLVHVREVDPEEGEPAVEWLLYTTEPVETVADVERVVDHYRTRWLSEELHGALKGGVAFESREFESRHALLNILALSLPVACEILALRSGARAADARPATAVLPAHLLRTLRTISHYPLAKNLTASDALLAVAALGGHLKRNGDPGWKVISRGMTELMVHDAAGARRVSSRKGDL